MFVCFLVKMLCICNFGEVLHKIYGRSASGQKFALDCSTIKTINQLYRINLHLASKYSYLEFLSVHFHLSYYSAIEM